MFGIGSTELLVILLVALIVLGPKSLASFSSKLGKLLGEFRKVSTDFQRTLNLEAARAEAQDAEKKQSASAAQATSGEGQKPECDAASKSVERDFDLHGIPEDSPVAKALKKAREDALKAERAAEGAMKEVEEAQKIVSPSTSESNRDNHA